MEKADSATVLVFSDTWFFRRTIFIFPYFFSFHRGGPLLLCDNNCTDTQTHKEHHGFVHKMLKFARFSPLSTAIFIFICFPRSLTNGFPHWSTRPLARPSRKVHTRPALVRTWAVCLGRLTGCSSRRRTGSTSPWRIPPCSTCNDSK